MKYVYPAIFTPEDTGFSVHFPDLEGCYTQGDTLPDAIEMAQDVLCLTLYDLEKNERPIPCASNVKDLTLYNNKFANLIACDTIEYCMLNDNASVKKTLTIPNWLNTLGVKNKINFSRVLQDALIEKLHIEIIMFKKMRENKNGRK